MNIYTDLGWSRTIDSDMALSGRVNQISPWPQVATAEATQISKNPGSVIAHRHQHSLGQHPRPQIFTWTSVATGATP